VSLGFLSPSPDAPARSPMERQARAAGASFEQRDGWSVAVGLDGDETERERCRASVGFADLSHLGKLELQEVHDLQLGKATCADGVWWCPFTAERVLVLGARRDLPELPEAIDVTTAFAALAIEGPLARELFARFTAIDLRDSVTPVHAFRPGSVARTPGAILRQAEDRWLMLFGAALGQYMWTVVADAAESLGGGPIGIDVLDRMEAARA
jgi:glycine cleavage system aminomethyltransferase T